jgi:Tol biopolymer transport system component
MRWDFASNTITPIFLPPQNGVVASSALSPDGKTLVMAYAPPPEQNKPNLGYTNLYTVSVDGSAGPAPLLQGDHSREFYFTPVWSPDGQYVYYGHYIEASPTATGPTGFFMERMAYPSGQGEVLLQYGFVPHLSPDGAKLVYISVDPNSYLNNLYAANADGTGAVSLIGPNLLWAIDAIAISPDGQTVIFSADSNGPTQSAVPWFYAWLGIHIAQAHSIPEDLYSVPMTGGQPTRLTNLGISGPSVAFSPDGQHVLVIGSTGAFIMSPDGSGQTTLINEPIGGSVQWEP